MFFKYSSSVSVHFVEWYLQACERRAVSAVLLGGLSPVHLPGR